MAIANAGRKEGIFIQVSREIDRLAGQKQACEVVVRIPLSPEGGVGLASMSVEKIRLK